MICTHLRYGLHVDFVVRKLCRGPDEARVRLRGRRHRALVLDKRTCRPGEVLPLPLVLHNRRIDEAQSRGIDSVRCKAGVVVPYTPQYPGELAQEARVALDDTGAHVPVEVRGREPVEEDRVVHDGDEGGEDRDEDFRVHVGDVGVCGDGEDGGGYDVGAHVFGIDAPLAHDLADAPFEFSIARILGEMDVDVVQETPDRMLGELQS